LCGQDLDDGGMRDKPGKCSDYYHSCYALSGLSICQSLVGKDEKLLYKNIEANRLNETDPIFNVDKAKLAKAREYFRSLPPIKK
jgi:Prenyltransferase, beta subunit